MASFIYRILIHKKYYRKKLDKMSKKLDLLIKNSFKLIKFKKKLLSEHQEYGSIESKGRLFWRIKNLI